jgi:tetratricopeptide (TPR) repeat protein
VTASVPPRDDGVTRILGEDRGDPIEERIALGKLKAALLGTDPAVRVDRYELGETIGEGGMGVVYRAWDPELARHVAIKVLRAGEQGSSATLAHQRLRAEAQAIARLSHPNVVAVHDVGRLAAHDSPTAGDGVYIVMELIEGRDLKAWIADGPHPWREAVEVFRCAAEGLAAAHEAGIVHRDFKPANVLLGSDGRPRVVDFGLARAAPTPGGAHDDDRNFADDSLTATGTVVGSPAYMAPEQHEGQPPTAAADQYAFCVSMWEALHGERPFRAASMKELHDRKLEGPPPAPASDVPPWVHQILARGLRAAPEERWPSMHALLDALADDPAIRRRRWWVGGAVVVALGLGAAAVVGWAQQRAALCSDPPTWSGKWSPQLRDRIHEAFRASGSPHAEDTAVRVTDQAHAWIGRWNDAHVETCEATRIAGAQSERVLELRMACLERAATEMNALLGFFERADAALVDRALTALSGVSTVEQCADPSYYLAELEPAPDEIAAAVADLRTRIAELRAAYAAGRHHEGLELARASTERADELGYRPAQAEARFWLGKLHAELARNDEAEATLEQAYFTALGSEHDRLAGEAGAALVALAASTGDLAGAERWSRHAREVSRRAGDPIELRARLAHADGNRLLEAGKPEEALALHQESLRLREQLAGASADVTAIAASAVGRTLSLLDRPREATPYFRRALDTWEAAYGERNPIVADGLTNVGINLAQLGQVDEALAYFERALALRREQLGDEHPLVAMSEANIAGLLAQAERHDAALPRLQAAYIGMGRTLDARDPRVLQIRVSIAKSELALGRRADALRTLRGLEADVRETLGADHPQLAEVVELARRAATESGVTPNR